MKKVSDLGIQVNRNDEGDLIFQSKICSLANFFLEGSSGDKNLKENLRNFIFSYLNQLKFTIEAYETISSLIEELNTYPDSDETGSSNIEKFSEYEIITLKHQDNPQIAHYGYIFFISAKTSFDMLICLSDLIMNKTVRKGSNLPDFFRFYSIVKKPKSSTCNKKYNECCKVQLLKPVFQQIISDTYVDRLFEVRNMLVHKGYLCKVSFYGKKSMGYEIFIEQGFNVPNPKKEEIKIEELAKAYFEAIFDMDTQISDILQNKINYLSNAPNSKFEVKFNGSFASYNL